MLIRYDRQGSDFGEIFPTYTQGAHSENGALWVAAFHDKEISQVFVEFNQRS
jgi:hypothetical protein